jgi:hypothetical protein
MPGEQAHHCWHLEPLAFQLFDKDGHVLNDHTNVHPVANGSGGLKNNK